MHVCAVVNVFVNVDLRKTNNWTNVTNELSMDVTLSYHLHGQSICGVHWHLIAIFHKQIPNVGTVSWHHNESMFYAIQILRTMAHEMWHSQRFEAAFLAKIFNWNELRMHQLNVWINDELYCELTVGQFAVSHVKMHFNEKWSIAMWLLWNSKKYGIDVWLLYWLAPNALTTLTTNG